MKLHVNGRTEAALLASRHGLTDGGWPRGPPRAGA